MQFLSAFFYAHVHSQTAREAFRIIDVNGDGYLQKEEVARAIKIMIEHGEMEANSSTPQELADKMLKEVDDNGDGQIDIEEFTSQMEKDAPNASVMGNVNLLTFNDRMSNIAKNVLMAHQQKLENSTVGRGALLHPLSRISVTWDSFVSMLILVTVITMPLCLGWEEINETMYLFNLMVDFVFLFDVCKNFCTGFVDDNETVIMDAKMIRKNYMRGFFVTDFCSSIPVDLILITVS